MSRHAAPEEDPPPPPPTRDTGPLFVQGDWPPLRPPEPDRGQRGSRTQGNGYRYELRREPGPIESRPVESRPVESRPVESRPVAPRMSRHPMVEEPVAHDPIVADHLVDDPPPADPITEDPVVDDQVDELGLLPAAPEAEKGHRRGRRGSAPRGRRRRPLGILISLGVIAALVAGIFVGGKALVDLFSSDPAADYTGQGSGSVEIEIPDGASTSRIADLLVDSDVVASAEAFLDAASGNPDIMTIQPGVYQMRLQMSAEAAVALILDPASRLFDRATIPEGYTVARTLESLAEQTDIPLAEFESAAAAPDNLGLPAWAEGRLEGFLFPATYDVGPDTTAVDILASMVAQFNEMALGTGLEANAAAVGLTPYEVLTVASLVQSEVTVEAERTLVARVIYNRLNQTIPLGIDAALAYELGINGAELTTEVLERDSPYNTRIRLGLPPTPISNPGQPSVLGALQPAAGDWIYYVLQNSEGNHLFTASYEEFLAAKAQCEAAGLGCG